MNALQVTPRSLTRGIIPTPDPIREPSEDDVAAFTLDGHVILVDTGDYLPARPERCLVIRYDGSIGIEYARKPDADMYCGSARSGLFDLAHKDSVVCTILGKVIRID